MAECPPGGWIGKGARCQFRPGFLKRLYPVCGDIMDVGPSTQTGISSSSCDFVSPSKGTRTRTVREYEQTISELKKENFDLKLRVFLVEESMSKISRKDSCSSDKDNTIQVIVQLKFETENLRNELAHKNKLLEESTDQVKKLSLEMKELEEKYADLQREMGSLSELPSKEEHMNLLLAKENLLKQNESLERCLLEKNENLHEAQQRIDILIQQNCLLEDKVRKRSLAIQGFVYKVHQEKEMLPDELRATVVQAVEAAKGGNGEGVKMAIKNFKASLCQILALEQRRNSSQITQRLPEESSQDQQKSFSSVKERSSVDLSCIQGLKRVIPERSTESFIPNLLCEKKVADSTSITRADVLICRDFSALARENSVSLSDTPESQSQLVEENVEDISSTFSPGTVNEIAEDGVSIDFHRFPYEQHFKEVAQLRGKMKENAAMTDLKTVFEEKIPSIAGFAMSSASEFSFQKRLKRTDCVTKKNSQLRELKDVYEERMPSVENFNSIHADEFPFQMPLKENEELNKEIEINAILIKDLRTECEEEMSFLENAISTHADEVNYEKVLEKNAELKEKVGENAIVQDLKTVCEEKMTTIESGILNRATEFHYQEHLEERKDPKEKTEEYVIQKETTCGEKIAFIENAISSCSEEFLLTECLKEKAELREKMEENVSIIDTRTVCDAKMSSVENNHSDEFQLLKENQEMRMEADKKMAVIRDLRVALEEHRALVEELQKEAPRASSCLNALVQTEISSCNLSQLPTKLNHDLDPLLELVKKSRESMAKQSLSTSQPVKDLNGSKQVALLEDNKQYDLYERLAFSCSVNAELVRHLRTLEAFMEELLQNPLHDSSSLETSSFLSGLSKCLNESRKLSSIFSDHLSICEESKIFEECKSILYKGASSFTDENSLHPVDASRLNLTEHSQTWNHQGTEMRNGRLSYGNENFRKEAFSQNPLCQRCWQQMSSIPEFSHQVVTPKHAGCPSSDSDIWSEPDRKVSMQRIGINLQNSPLPSKSPRKLRSKERRGTGRLSTDHNASSSEMQSWSRNRRIGCRRLFVKDNFALEKYYYLVAEKFSKLRSLRSAFKDVEYEDEASTAMDSVLSSLERTLHKLEVAREHSTAVCGRCALQELLMNLQDLTSLVPSSSKSKVLLQFLQETRLLQEECEEPIFSFSSKVRESTQLDPLNRSEPNKIVNLEQVVTDLNEENRKLTDNLDEVQSLLGTERKKLESLRAENIKLSSDVNKLKNEISNLQLKEVELSLQNTRQTEELVSLGRNHCELKEVLKILETQKNASDAQLDQLIAELQNNKSELKKMSMRCLELEKELSEQSRQKEECFAKFKDMQAYASSEKEKYLTDIESLISGRNSYAEELKIVKEKLLSLEKENCLLNDKLNAKDSKLSSLMETVQNLQTAKETLNITCTELQTSLESAKEQCLSLELKCRSSEENVFESRATCEKYRCQVQQLETRFLSEKEKLLCQISLLTSEKDDVLQKLKCEKDNSETLLAETLKLNEKLVESSEQLTLLRLSNKELEDTECSLLQKVQHIENALVSSDSERETLRGNLKYAHETLLSLESRCSTFEKEIVASAGMRDNVVECLLSIKNELSNTRRKISEMCKVYDSSKCATLKWDSAEFIPVIDEENVAKLSEAVALESKLLLNTIDGLLEILKGSRAKLQEVDSIEGRCNIKIMSFSREMELQKHEISHLEAQKEHLEKTLEEKQKSEFENQKAIKLCASENHSLRERLQNSENEKERAKLLLKMKEDEITMLQERIFNLQTYINNMLVEKVGKPDDSTNVSVGRHSLSLPPAPPILENEPNLSSDSLSATPSPLRRRSSSCEKCHSTQTKLAICRKRIEMLEEEKKDLREFHNSRGSLESTHATVSELESKLEQKKLFIGELKGELLKVCNSLIDKEREVDDLKMKLSEYETKSRNMLEGLCGGLDTERRTLKNYKWKLIQSICDIQKRFSEEKGIHLNYFDKFKNQMNHFDSLQVQPLSKSVSLPVLKYHPLRLGHDFDWDSLQLDIECLENFKIFLSHFFIPSIVSVPKSTSKMDSASLELPAKLVSEGTKIITSNQLTPKQKELLKPLGSATLSIPPPTFCPINKYSSYETAATTISYHLDFMETFFNAVEEFEVSLSADGSFKVVSDYKEEDRSLLQRVLREIHSLHKGAKVLLSLNTHIKNSGLFRSDVSDSEESDETVAVSRSETPLYREDPSSRNISVEPRVMNHSSCESIHHRSQYSSPDLGIESDPNHEQREEKVRQISVNNHESSGTLVIGGDCLCAIGTLPHYELLQRLIQESLVGMRSVLSRTGDGLHHIVARHSTTTSPRKTLEYSTLRAIKDTCGNVETCLKKGYQMVKMFRIAHCPSDNEWNALTQENQRLLDQMTKCRVMMQNQESEYKKAMEKLEHAQNLKTSMEKKISKKLVKTKKVIRQAELKLLENGCQNYPPLPKYPSDDLLQRT